MNQISYHFFASGPPTAATADVHPAERERVLDERWDQGGLAFLGAFTDTMVSAEANEVTADFVRAMADPNDPEHEHFVEWIGVDTWDPAVFDSTEANDRLAQIKL